LISKRYSENPHILGATVQNLFARATWRPGFLYPWSSSMYSILTLKIRVIWHLKQHIMSPLCRYISSLVLRGRTIVRPY